MKQIDREKVSLRIQAACLELGKENLNCDGMPLFNAKAMLSMKKRIKNIAEKHEVRYQVLEKILYVR